ncbi:acylphosphatase [Candidatus Woesearchaeota archaeon]|nr:acylphosphatase [Candidatus Woesearchaeota archaeon]
MVIKRVRMVLKGKVQKVFFRDFAKQNANKSGIVGYARNMKNGCLEIVAQGEEKKLNEYIILCQKGPIFAKVESTEINYEDVEDSEEEGYFDIRYS